MKRYHQYRDIPSELLTRLKDQVKKSPYRQRFHIESDMGYLNDPNGVSYFDGKYHLFYQWSPLTYSEDSWYQGWYHLTSKDLVIWQDEGVGIQTDTVYETHGAYSGSAIADGEQLIIFYTGNTRDDNYERIPYQLIAHFDKEGHLAKIVPPAITGYPTGYTDHFRDPKIWKTATGNYLAVIGAQRENSTGTAILMQSSNHKDWGIVGEVETNFTDFGYMWECPNYFELDNSGILLFSPQGLKPEGNAYQNIYQTGYIIGDIIDESNHCLTKNGKFWELDKGFDFYAAQVMQENDRTILFAWMGLPEISYPTEEYSYCGCLTLPRELSLEGGQLKQRPISELKNYRKVSIENVELEANEFTEVIPFGSELALSLKCENQELVTIDLVADENREHYTRLICDFKQSQLILDRSVSGQPVGEAYGTTRVIHENFGMSVDLQIFLDRSSIEIFINDGESVASSRIFPDENQTHLFVTKERSSRVTLSSWKLDLEGIVNDDSL